MKIFDIARKALQEKVKNKPDSTLVCIHNPSPTIRHLQPAK